jgi:uncharacterized repeat protein (TIGR01451 family)
MRIKAVAIVMYVLIWALGAGTAQAQSYTVTTIVVPNYPYGPVPTGLSQDGWVVGGINFGPGGSSGWIWVPDTPNGKTGTATVFPQNGFWQVSPTAVANGPGGHYVTFNDYLIGNQNQRGYVYYYDVQNHLTVYGPTSCFNPSWAPNYPSVLYAVNTLGDAAGYTGCAQQWFATSWSWPYTVPHMVSSLAGSETHAINNQGVMTGYDGHAFIAFPGGAVLDLPPTPDALSNCSGLSINESNEVAGTCIQRPDNGGGPRAWIYSSGHLTEISCALGPCIDARANGINNHSVVVGAWGSTGAFSWDREHGVRDLNTMVPPGTPWLSAAYAINDAGQILAQCGDSSHGTLQPCLLTPVPTADLSIAKTAVSNVTIGDSLTYTIAVSNAGPSAATGVTVTDTLPGGATLVSATPSAGICGGTTTVTCAVAGLASGASATVTVVVTANAIGSLTNTASVHGDQADPVSSNNSAAATTTVSRKRPVLTWDTPAAISYGTALGSGQLDASADTAGTFVYSPAAGTMPHVGSLTLNVMFTPASSDYETATASVVLTVNPAPLTIRADDKTKAYGAALPALTVSYSGFVNGDTPASLATGPSLSTAATAASHVTGSPYAIMASGAADPDYAIAYIDGGLTVTPAPLTISADNKSKVYGAPLPALTASYNGFVNGDTPASLAAAPVVTTTATASSSVGSYPIVAAGAADSDYTIAYGTGMLMITPQVTAVLMSVSPSASTVVGQPVTFLASVAGTIPGSSVPTGVVTFTDGGSVLGSAAMDGSGVARLTTSSLAAGSHSIVATYAGDGNFTGGVSLPLVLNVTSPSSTASIADLISRVNALGLNAGQRNSLLAKLQASQASLDRGNRTAAVNQLGAFINEVQALGRSGQLTSVIAGALVAEAQAVIAGI